MVIISIPSLGDGGMKELLSSKFGRCQSFTFVTIDQGNITAVKSVPNHLFNSEGGMGPKAAQIVKNNGANEIIAEHVGYNAFESLKSLNMKIYQAPDQKLTIKQCVDLYLKGELQEMKEPNLITKE